MKDIAVLLFNTARALPYFLKTTATENIYRITTIKNPLYDYSGMTVSFFAIGMTDVVILGIWATEKRFEWIRIRINCEAPFILSVFDCK